MNKKIAVLGSTGSIGRQTLQIAESCPGQLEVVGLAAGRNWPLLVEQVKKFRPAVVAVAGETEAVQLRAGLGAEYKVEIYTGAEGLEVIASLSEVDTVVTAVTGTVGLSPTVAAIKAGKHIALANKETLVAAGELVMQLADSHGISILPVDSEHSAIWQCLNGEKRAALQKIILTASGGPFREKSLGELAAVTVEMALAHPNWSMGKKITVDSATLMNKGLEVIEAHWLYDVAYESIQVVIHPQSIIHSMVEFVDGSVIAQLGLPDMRLPIQYALSYPDRWESKLPRLDFKNQFGLTFEPPDFERFPCLGLAFAAGRTGGTMPVVLNAANETAVAAFLEKRLSYQGIASLVDEVMNLHRVIRHPDLETVLQVDSWARRQAARLIGKL
jgi:1-deoxy-D-xylulose-5-phosphate reductoisomerase